MQNQESRARRCLLLVFVILVLAWVQSAPVLAQGMLKAQNENTRALRTKALKADIKIRGAFAETQIFTTFQNERNAQTEADFQYTVPDGAVVTYFAYWFKGEKVVARVVEKERAADIYQTITRPRGDPALIERINKNTFRARIFPIEANADLKVEMRWVQALASDERGAFYTLPLKSPDAGKGTLENLDVRVEVRPGTGVTKVVNNYKLAAVAEDGAQVFNLSEKNYRAPQDLIIRQERPVRALHASLYAARSGGPDGFFALALTPSQNLTAPRLQMGQRRFFSGTTRSPAELAGTPDFYRRWTLPSKYSSRHHNALGLRQ